MSMFYWISCLRFYAQDSEQAHAQVLTKELLLQIIIAFPLYDLNNIVFKLLLIFLLKLFVFIH